MPRPHLPFVQRQITRHGRKVWYFRRNRSEPRIRLPDLYGSDEFTAAYRACLAGQPMVVRNQRPAPKTKFKGLIDLYLKSSEWQAYKPMTRKTRGHIYEKWAALGYDTEDITRSVIIEALEARKETREQANSILTALKNLFAWAVSADHVDRNPCEGIKGLKPKKAVVDEEDGHKTWSEEELAQFERAYPLGSSERLVYSILLYTGLRIGDAARLGRQHIQKDGTIQLRNEKTGAVVYLPILTPLRQALAAGPKGRPEQLAFITLRRATNVGKEHLGAWFSEAAERAGLVDCTAHGIRKAAARRLAEAGATVNQLMAIFGWTRPDMAIKYTREADKKLMAAEAIGGLVRAETENVYSLTAILGEGTVAETGALSIS
jgi:integrase